MTGALSPSMVNVQVPFTNAGHLKAASHTHTCSPSPQKKHRRSSSRKTSTLASSPAPSLSSPCPVKRGRGLKRTSSTASILDTVMNSRAATDHDSVPAYGLGLPTSTSNVFEYSRSSPFASSSQTTLADLEDEESAKVLSTPRRGKRVGNVDMGWQSPIGERTPTAASVAAASAPHTLPKLTRASRSLANVVGQGSPSKRKASTAFASELRTSQRSLVDTAGWASAAMISSVPLSEDRSKSSPGFPPRFIPEPTMTSLTTAETRDSFSAFIVDASPVVSQSAKLVPVEVEGLGRVAVHRDFAQQIVDHPPIPDRFSSRRFSACSDREAPLLRGSDSEDSAARSENGCSTDPTSAGTPCPSGISPSFSLSSQFPASEPPSPVKKMNHKSSAQGAEEIGAEAQEALMALMRMDGVDAVRETQDKAYRPRLGGSASSSSVNLPTLDWPDCPSGSWSAAGRHIDELKQKRREGIQRWLEVESSDETESSSKESSDAAFRHHPMVAKALLDRARKHQRAQLVVAAAAVAPTPSKRGRKSKHQQLLRVSETPKRRGRKPKAPASAASSSRKSVATGASLARSNTSAIFGCKCGIDDDSIVMVQCDGCKRWLHLPCVGINTVNDLDDEWYCDDCCDAAITEHLSPASSMPTSVSSYAHLSTPEALEAVLSGQEPVFTMPSGTPIHRHGVAVSSSIALAPSPPLLPVGDRAGRASTAKRQGQGRSRAERVGWRMNEPGSPLARKSTTASSGVRPAVPETPSKASQASTADFTDASTTPSLLAGFSRADWEPTRVRQGSERQTTPVRSMVGMSTPSRHASGRKISHSGALSLGLGDDEGAHADVFSTPSRLASGGSWAYRGTAQGLGSQTPSRSGDRHQRVDSFSGGLLSTPGRDFLSRAFGTEPSTSMPSLVYSSGYVDGFDDHLSAGGESFNSRAWQLQSPTSSTRAARARQPSGFGTPWSSSLLKTPELQPRQANTSSMRSSDDFPPSSSPFPRTPTFDSLSSPRFMSSHYGGGHERRPSHLGLGLPSGSKLHKGLGSAAMTGRDDSRSLSVSSASGGNGGKHRQVSTEVPMGLGIGLDLDDVLDWS
ncbi:uncharacterized protein MEPE_03025 [Melanopsichium pennsylvanicum]|uniref:Zinc finger PHD-type domain-containing protein n=2 Tax=Melanopsichium pennsylvanicum TaxID=63383 RepID=A0AAJ5C530_9BASI|nr:putative protein [Melanopsichium pennsylvanicum 4]SNX84316.1 uncharacterized protein MEPE_03025 [Melanopsichium pennsylvanicum]